MNGTNPQNGKIARPADASRFFKSADMKTAIEKAENFYAANPNAYPKGNVNISFNKSIGEGYMGNTKSNINNGVPVGQYRWSNIATVGIDRKTGKAYTAYPNLNKGSIKK